MKKHIPIVQKPQKPNQPVRLLSASIAGWLCQSRFVFKSLECGSFYTQNVIFNS